MEDAEIYLALKRGKGGSGGAVEGTSQADGHKGSIELFDWRWGLELGDQSPSGKDQDRQAEGKMLEVSKAVDAASVPMMSILKSGETCGEATITVVQRTQKEIELKIILTDVRLMACKLNVKCDDKEVVLDEDWTLSYDKVEVRYKSPHGNKGQKIFSLTMPAGIDQSEPARLSAVDTGSGDSDNEPRFTKQDIIDIIEEYLKKHPQTPKK